MIGLVIAKLNILQRVTTVKLGSLPFFISIVFGMSLKLLMSTIMIFLPVISRLMAGHRSVSKSLKRDSTAHD